MGGVLLAMFRRRLPAVVEGGFDWADVRDVVRSMLAAEIHGRRGENYLLPGHNLSLAELAAVAERVTGRRRPHFTVPMWFARIWSPLANVISRRSRSPLWYTSESMHALRFNPAVSGARAEAELGHSPRPVDETIADTYEWFIAQGCV
jgi:dihydroflavonol-4-reductase